MKGILVVYYWGNAKIWDEETSASIAEWKGRALSSYQYHQKLVACASSAPNQCKKPKHMPNIFMTFRPESSNSVVPMCLYWIIFYSHLKRLTICQWDNESITTVCNITDMSLFSISVTCTHDKFTNFKRISIPAIGLMTYAMRLMEQYRN